MHYEIVTDKRIYSYATYKQAYEMYKFLLASNIKATLKGVPKVRI